MTNYPDSMSGTDMDHVEGVGMETHTYEARVWITFTGEQPEQTTYELAKDIERVLLRYLDFTPDQVEAEVDEAVDPSRPGALDALLERPRVPAEATTMQIKRIERLS